MLEEPMFRRSKEVHPPPSSGATNAPPRRPLAGNPPNSTSRPTMRPPQPSSKVSNTSKALSVRTAKSHPPAANARAPIPKTTSLSKPSTRPPPANIRPGAPKPMRNGAAGTAPSKSGLTPVPTQQSIVQIDIPVLDIVEIPLDEEPEFSLDL